MEKIKKPSVSIVIPVYNEEAELAKSIQTLVSYFSTHLSDFRWIVTIADNASTDSTYALATKLAKENPKIYAIHLDQKGRGRAVKYVWSRGEYDYLVYMDVDLSTDLKHIPPILHALQRGYDIAIGSRNLRGSQIYGRNLIRTITSKGYILLIKLLFWVHFSDAQCGFKAITKRVKDTLLPSIQDNEWFFDSELLIVGEKEGYRIYEEPVTWIDNPGSTVRVYKTALGDLAGLHRLYLTRPWKQHALWRK